MNDKNIDDLFRDKLKDLEKAPPAYLFDNVMAGVTALRRKRRLLYWRIGSVAAALLLAFVAGWQISEINSRGNQQPVVVHQNASVQKEEIKSERQQTLSNEKAQPVTDENKTIPAAKRTNNNSQLASRNVPSEKNHADQSASSATVTVTQQMDPIRTIGVQVEQKEQFANVLETKKEEPAGDEITGPSVDEQIIQQNVKALQAQNDKQRKNRWMVGAQVSPAVNVNRSSHSTQYASSMLNASNSKVDLGGGISVEYKPAKRWSVQSGIYYAGIAQTSGNLTSSRGDYAYADIGMGYFNAPVNIVSDKMMMNSTAGVIELKNIPSGMVVGTNIEDKSLSTAVVVSDAKFIQNFQYLEIPLYLRYTLVDARFDVQLLGGISSNVLVGNNTYLDSNSGKSLIGKTQEMQDMSYSSTLGLGVKYGLSKRIYLNVEPRVKYYLNSLNNNPEVNYKPYSIGVFTGVSYQF